jgi:hypothetical protein
MTDRFSARVRLWAIIVGVLAIAALLFAGDKFSGSAGATSAPPISNAIPDLGAGASLHGARLFPYNNPWNEDISRLPVDGNSANLIASIGNGTGLHPDFGTVYQGAPIGIPYIVVAGTQPTVPIVFNQFGPQSDPGPYPVPPTAPIEGAPGATSGDRHVLVIDRDNWKLYEMYAAASVSNGVSWTAGSGAIYNLNSNAVRPAGWTSADAAGLPIFPGLVRYDEVVEQHEIKHAIRFTVQTSRQSYVYPARHQAGSTTSVNAPPMGMRVRLKASVNISTYPANVQVILRAMKKYGMIVADNGSNWYVGGAPDPRWSDDELSHLSGVKGSDFEVVQTPNHLDYPVADFDGDGRTDISVFRPTDGGWYSQQSTDGAFRAQFFGAVGDVPVAADYDGDGLSDIAVFRSGIWYISNSSNGAFRAVAFGAAGDVPVPGDFDSDGKVDLAIYRQGGWYWLRSTNGALGSLTFGLSDDKPVPADFDGDGVTDQAVWRPATGTWYIQQSATGTLRSQAFGANGDMPATGDYDADGKTDLGVFRPANGVWYVWQSTTSTLYSRAFGTAGDLPVPADYDRDGKTDLAVFRSGIWYVMNSYDSTLTSLQFGAEGDIPVPGLRN